MVVDRSLVPHATTRRGVSKRRIRRIQKGLYVVTFRSDPPNQINQVRIECGRGEMVSLVGPQTAYQGKPLRRPFDEGHGACLPIERIEPTKDCFVA